MHQRVFVRRYQRKPMVRTTSMLSISRVMPPTLGEATIRPMSVWSIAKADSTSTLFRLS